MFRTGREPQVPILASRLRAEDGECDGRRVVPQLRLMTAGSEASGHEGEVFSVAYAPEGGFAGCRFTPDGAHLFSWSHDRTARVWDLARVRHGRRWAATPIV